MIKVEKIETGMKLEMAGDSHDLICEFNEILKAMCKVLDGDTLDEHCKEEEIARLKAEQGIQDMEEPAVNMDAGNFRVDLEGGEGDEGKGRTKNVPDEPEGVPGTAQNSKGAGTNGNLRSGES